MARRFKKNNVIYESDSEDENSSDDGESSSDSSVASCDSESSHDSLHSSQKCSPKSVTKDDSKNYDVNVTINESRDSTLGVSSGNDSEISVVEKNKTIGACNDEFSDDNSCNSMQPVVEQPASTKINDVLVVESSLSVDGESVIESSGPLSTESDSVIENSEGEVCSDALKKTFTQYRKDVNEIVGESSDSDNSVEFIDSVGSITSVNSDFLCAPKVSSTQINFSTEVAVVENSFQSNSSLKNISNLTIETSSSSHSSQVSVSTISANSIDEKRALEQQLADKRTAYQNILRAVKCCDPSRLKDGGKLLREKLAHCKEEVNELKEKLKNYGDVSSDKSTEKISTVPNPIFSTTDQVTSNLGKRGLETHNVHQALTLDSLVTLHNSIETCPADNVQEQDPKGLRAELMPHQKYALAWLLWREQQVPAGGILADDMGLGKTLTMIALVLRSAELTKEMNKDEENNDILTVDNVKMYPGKTLVVCPSSLIGQWQGQIKQHCKPRALNSLIHHGKPRELQAKKLALCDVVITSYGVVVEENKILKGNKKGALLRVKWERVIIDEGHVIRNHKTKTAQALCELEAKYRWCLTGTPVQNRELDMYSLLKFLRCSPFDNLTVWKRWVDNKSANGTKRLNTILKSILLRRTKEELKNTGELKALPKKTFIPVQIELDKEEEKVYHTVLRFSKNLLAEYLAQEGKKAEFSNERLRDEHRRLINSVNEIKTTEIFVLLLRLRQICCLPGLIHSMLEKDSCQEDGIDVEEDPVLQDLTKHMKRMSMVGCSTKAEEEKNQKVLIKSNPVFEITRPSAKIRTVVKIVKEALDADDKIVVVSQWANFLQKLKNHILLLNTGLVILDGSVPVKLRSKIIDDFNDPNSDVQVMLLSLTAGGVGLNLVGGNRLVIIEPHWNPQLESQACDRIYRVGQKKPVHVYKIICKNTIEEKIEMLQKKKLNVAETVLKGELALTRHKITLADLKILFDVAH